MAINFNTDPYYDDYNELKDFYRILFRPGVAVQARELTQLQTILQNQVSKVGDHFFKNGSQIIPGSVNIDPEVHFAKIEATEDGVDVTTYLSSFQNMIVTGETSGVKALVLDSSECECVVDDTIPTLYFKIETTGTNGEDKYFELGEKITAYAADNTTTENYRLTSNLAEDITVTIQSPVGATVAYPDHQDGITQGDVGASTNVMGYGLLVEVKEGVYYIDGLFVRNPELHLYVGRFANNPTARVGFKVVENIITPEQDETLLDPSQGSFNYTAPGAHRYNVTMELVELDETSVSADGYSFIELLRLKNGFVQQKITKTDYAELEKTMARRTFDESGSYEVAKFRLSTREHLNDGTNFGVYPETPAAPATPDPNQTYGDVGKFVLAVDPGKAYVEGYEIEATKSTFVAIDKARDNNHVIELPSQSVGTPIGNYLIVTDVKGGTPDLINYQTVDLVNNYTHSGNHLGAQTAEKVGTAKIKAFELYSGDYSGTPEFKLALFDVQMNAGKSVFVDVKGIREQDTAGTIVFGANVVPSDQDGFRTGTATNDGNGDSIVDATTITGTGTLFRTEFADGDVVLIDGVIAGTVDGDPTDNESMTITNPAATVLQGKIQNFRAVFNDPEYPELMFPLGYDNIKTLVPSSVDMITTVRREVPGTIAATANAIEHSLTASGETFESDQNIENFLVINTSNNPATIEDIDSGDITFNNDANRTTVTISNLSGATDNYKLYVTVRQSNAGRKSKTLEANESETLTTKKNVTKSKITLAQADVLTLVDVRMTPGDYATYNDANSISIKDRYTLDNGQRSTHYQAATISLIPGKKAPTGAIKIIYDYFSHGSTGNYFSVDSYTTDAAIDYEDIPTANLTTGREVNLSDVLDFRPVISGSNTTDIEFPKIGEDASTSFSYYLGRVDKIVLTSEGKFQTLSGVPSLNPKEPADPRRGLVIAALDVPPYTKSIDSVNIRQRNNRRYSMKDIGHMERRLSRVEEYVSLTQLEKLAADFTIINEETGIPRFKNGFITDQFTGTDLADVTHPDFRAAVDKKRKELRPMHFTTALDVVENITTNNQRASIGYQKTGEVLTLPYSETSFIYNPYASRSIDVNPYKLAAFKGEVVLTPAGDNWKETERRPDLQVTDNNNADAIRFMAEELGITGTVWEEWEQNWTGRTVEEPRFRTFQRIEGASINTYQTQIITETGTETREGLQTTVQDEINTQDYGDRVIDMTYIPYMRSRPVTFTARNFKPNTRFYAFFDEINVNSYITPANIFRVSLAGGTLMDFDQDNLFDGFVPDDPARSSNRIIQPAFQVGDVIRNDEHTATDVTAINGGVAFTGASSFDITVASATGLRVGHYVTLYNLDHGPATTYSLPNAEGRRFAIPESDGLNDNTASAAQLNRQQFVISAVSGTTVTLENIDGTDVGAFDAYDTASYDSGKYAQIRRHQASGVVSYTSRTYTRDSDGNPTDQDIFVINVQGGFSVGEDVSGSAPNSSGNVNDVTIDKINDNASSTTVSTYKAQGDRLDSDYWGSVCGVFEIPQNDTLAFRTGERQFKIIDNVTNSDTVFDSKGSAIYYAQGIKLTKERTIVNSRDVQFVEDRVFEEQPIRRVSTSQRLISSQIIRRHDPVAQTFTVAQNGGVMLTSVDVFFQEGGNRPITVELRTTNSGIPSTKILPFTTVTKLPDEVNTSEDGSSATNFKFQAPVYLQNGETYALVVKTDEPGCQLFVSEVGKTDLVTGNTITVNPLTGSLYLSQNSIEFEINPLFDMKMRLNAAEFDTSATPTVELKAVPPLTVELVENPFTFGDGTNKIRIAARNHGLKANNTVEISGVAEFDINGDEILYGGDGTNGIPARVLNGTHSVVNEGLDTHSFLIEFDTTDGNGNSNIVGTTSNFIDGTYGGTGVVINRNLDMDILYLKTGEVQTDDTTITYEVKAQDSAGTETDWIPVIGDAQYPFDARKLVRSFENQPDGTPSVNAPEGRRKTPSLQIRATISSTNSTVSPIIDLQKMSAYVISNLINDATNDVVNVPELDAIDLLVSGTVAAADTRTAGTGQITTLTSSTTVSVSSGDTAADFTNEVEVGDSILASDDTFVGIVASITDGDNLELEANAAVALTSESGYKIQSNSHVKFYNSGGKGYIKASLDTADNILANASYGKWIYINNLISQVNGSYEVEDVTVNTASSDFAGNTDGDEVLIQLATTFDIDKTFNLNLVDDEVQFAGTGTITTSTASTTVTGTTTDFSNELIPGYKLIAADGTVLGVIDTVASATSATLVANAAADITGGTYKVRNETTTYQIAELQKYVADYAPSGAYNLANYVSRPLILNDPADSIKIIFDANIPPSTDVQVYYKTGQNGDDFADERWIDTGFSNSENNLRFTEFTQRLVTLEDLTFFDKITVKIVMKSSNPINVPRLKNLRLIAYS